MIRTGLVSVTFRGMSPRQIVEITAKAGLDAVEWGGDIHVPHGNLSAAREAGQLTTDAGLAVAAYGSYYRVGQDESGFEKVLEAAIELGAPTVRVWAGSKGSNEADEAYRKNIVEDSRRIGDLADAAGLTISYEFHGGTLTDTNQSAIELLKEVSHKSVKAYWQPAIAMDPEYRLAGLEAILPWLSNVHVFHWGDVPTDRRLLSEGAVEWKRYLECVSSTERDHFALIEFVQDDDPDKFIQDAETLKRLVA
ncbi:MAG: TIM barrel protein [Armatimonadota bacterium]